MKTVLIGGTGPIGSTTAAVRAGRRQEVVAASRKRTIHDHGTGMMLTGEMTDIIVKILRTACQEMAPDQDVARSHIHRAIELLSNERARLSAPDRCAQSGLAPWRMRLAETYIEEHLNSPIKLGDIAGAARLSSSHFARGFKRSFGETPSAYLSQRRIARAMEMMLETDEALSQIASACGFSDQAHLSRIFRRTQGISPARWRRLRRSLLRDAA